MKLTVEFTVSEKLAQVILDEMDAKFELKLLPHPVQQLIKADIDELIEATPEEEREYSLQGFAEIIACCVSLKRMHPGTFRVPDAVVVKDTVDYMCHTKEQFLVAHLRAMTACNCMAGSVSMGLLTQLLADAEKHFGKTNF